MKDKNHLYIHVDQNEYREYHEEDFSRSSIEIKVTENVFLSRESSSEFWLEQVNVDFEPKKGQKVFAVIPRYTSGGTFGTTRGYYTVFGIYSTEENANEMKDFLNLEYKAYKSGERIQNSYRPWMGYFESLNDIEIHELTVVK